MEIVKLNTPSSQEIKNLIYEVRSKQVMLDSDLAKLYGVETRVLNQAVSRNSRRFPEHFCFRLNDDEAKHVTSQIVMLRGQDENISSYWRHSPRVFTEQGVSMLSAVLHSDTAIEVSIKIMDAFVEMRHFITTNASMFEQIKAVELRQLEYQKSTDERFACVFDYMDAQSELQKQPTQKVFFSGEIYDAFEFLIKIVRRAQYEILLIDNYVDIDTFNILAKKKHGVNVVIYTRSNTKLSNKDIEIFNAQYPLLEIKYENNFHDCFLFLDGREGYLIGASLKDAGKKSFAISKLEDESLIQLIKDKLSCNSLHGWGDGDDVE